MKQAKVVARGTSVSLLGAFSLRGFNYLLSIVVARALGPSLFGLFSFGLSIVTVAQTVALLGLDVGGARFTARYRTQHDPAAQRKMMGSLVVLVFVWGSLLSVGYLLFVGPIAHRSDQEITLATQTLRWFAPAIPLSALLILLTAFTDGQRRVGIGVLTRDVLRPALTVVLSLGVLWLGRNIISVVQVYAISFLIAVLVTGGFIYRFAFPRGASAPDAPGFKLKEVLNFSLPIFPARILKQVGNFLEIFLLGFLASSADVGIFSAAARSATLVAFGLQAIMRIYMTLAAELHTKGDLRQLETLQHLATRWATLISLPALIIVLLLGSEIMGLFGKAFVPYTSVLIILSLGQAVNAATGPIGGTLAMAGHSRLVLLNSLFAITLNLVLDWVLILQYGVLGAAIGSSVVLVLTNLLAVIEVQYLLKIRSFGRDLLPPAIAGIVTYAAVWFLLRFFTDLSNFMYLLLGIALVGVIFSGVYWFVAPKEDKEIAASALARLKKS